MSAHKPWYRTVFFLVAAGLLLAVMGLLAVASSNQPESGGQSAAAGQQISGSALYQNTTDSSAHDAQDESKVNFPRLKEFISKIQGRPIDTASLDSQINQIINDNQDIRFGVAINYLNTGQAHHYGVTSAMTAASVTKVLTAVDYYKQVELGYRSLNTVMSNGQTAQANLEHMIVASDNNAWHVLNEALTYQQLQTYAEGIGLNSYYYADNTINVGDTTKLLADMYQRKLINETNTEQLLSYMERANYRDLVIPAVPASDTVYHKAGEYGGYLHDATIITNGTNTVVLTIFTQSTHSYDAARVAQLMQQITAPALTTFHLD